MGEPSESRHEHRDEPRFRGFTGPHHPDAYSLSGLERYQDCPFKFFASDVLRLDEPAEDGGCALARARGRFVHELLQQFFAAWDARGEGGITPARLDAARAVFAEVAEPLLARLPQSDCSARAYQVVWFAAVRRRSSTSSWRRRRSRPGTVRERWLEYRLEGEFSLGGDPTPPSGRRVPLRGVADRIDLLEGNRLRVIDYKTGSAPERTAPFRCRSMRCAHRSDWPHATALPGRSTKASTCRLPARSDRWYVWQTPVIPEMLATARERVFGLVDQINAGEFPPRPHDPIICSYCAYASVCRKDYVE